MKFGIYLFLAKFLIVPAVVFTIKPNTTSWIKSARLLFLIVVYFLISLYTSMFYECFPLIDNGCLEYKLFFLALNNLLFITYVGWWEYIWRRANKKITWSFKENLQYGIISNLVILVSGFMTLLFIFIGFVNFFWFPLFRGY